MQEVTSTPNASGTSSMKPSQTAQMDLISFPNDLLLI